MRNVIFGVLAIGLVVFYYFSTPRSNPDWIHGTWIIKTKVKDSVIENFTFNPDGTMIFGNSNGVVYNDCTYSFYSRTTIDFECSINGKKAIFPLEVSRDNSVITTTNGNIFTKDI
ncbi:hypothetical protein [Kangiella sp. HZ709]|uniref:hypothetical protein n=1 Tax=Kangiella sp. HZ709 TaxID=2666328 RepID=UPI0012B052D2|nr:hypothetical protein [Kangiella sp. HZ709]MRX27983.1 hypothetical protein [Kangiella sp. HZ709]